MQNNQFSATLDAGYLTIWIEDQAQRFVGIKLDPYCVKKDYIRSTYFKKVLENILILFQNFWRAIHNLKMNKWLYWNKCSLNAAGKFIQQKPTVPRRFSHLQIYFFLICELLSSRCMMYDWCNVCVCVCVCGGALFKGWVHDLCCVAYIYISFFVHISVFFLFLLSK